MTVLDHGGLMDRVYRRQRHVYDATRKYYLLGRDPMIAGLLPPENGHVLEIGCGTGRNLVAAARDYPTCRLYGIDISREMLATAGHATAKAGLGDRVRLAHSDAARFDPARSLGCAAFDRIFISYAVSMIPDWTSVMADALRHLAPGGELHIVDFGDLAGLPNFARRALYTWLGWYHVTPRNDLFEVSRSLAAQQGSTVATRRLLRGYAWISVISVPQQPTPPLLAEPVLKR